MKKIFTIFSMLVLTALVLSACSKRGYYENDESYWLRKERGEVVYSDSYCPYFVVETYNGYAVIRAISGFTPYEGSVVYGDFSHAGIGDMYNSSDGTIQRGDLIDYWLTYGEAQNTIDNLCY
jgi:hypothetical protein